MTIGLDYWQVVSHHPDYFGQLISLYNKAGIPVFILSAVDKARSGTVTAKVMDVLRDTGWTSLSYVTFEVVYNDVRQAPELKLAKCQELGITAFYDDREDVCKLLNKHGILAMRVMRKDHSTYDLEAEQR